jgi:hypothetical protein
MSNINFSVNASILGKDAPSDLTYDLKNLYFETSGDPSIGFDGKIGGSVYAKAAANLGLNYDVGFGLLGKLQLSGGTVGVIYSFDPNVKIGSGSGSSGGLPYLDTSGFSVGPSILATNGFDLSKSSIDVDLAAKLKADLHGSASFEAGVDFGATYISVPVWRQDHWWEVPWITSWQDVELTKPIKDSIGGEGSFATKLVDFDGKIDLLHLDGSEVKPFDLDYGYGALHAELPSQINTTDTTVDSQGRLEAAGDSKPFLAAGFDAAKAIASAFGIPPQVLKGKYGFDAGSIAHADINYDLISASFNGAAKLEQHTSFDPDVDIHLKTSYGETLDGKLGDKFSFNPPNGQGDFDVEVTYDLGGKISSEISVVPSAEFDYDLLKASVGARINASVLGYDVSQCWESPTKSLLDGKLALATGMPIPIFTDVSVYSVGQKTETYKVHYGNPTGVGTDPAGGGDDYSPVSLAIVGLPASSDSMSVASLENNSANELHSPIDLGSLEIVAQEGYPLFVPKESLETVSYTGMNGETPISGRFAEVAENTWVENDIFYFEEVSETGQSITIFDPSRGVTVAMDLVQGNLSMSWDNYTQELSITRVSHSNTPSELLAA